MLSLRQNSIKSIFAILLMLIAGVVLASVIGAIGLPQLRLFPKNTSLNSNLLFIAEQYSIDGSYQVLPESEQSRSYGLTQDIFYMGRRVAEGDPEKRSYCIGLMFEIYMKACQRVGGQNVRLSGISTTNFANFRRDWYGVDGNRRAFVRALAERGLGEEITDLRLAQRGDLVQFWRIGGSGHSVLFLGWRLDESGNIIGIHYWSIQSRTGISENVEYFSDAGGAVLRDQVFIVRAFVP